jgi:hypothetical protein
VVDRVWVESYSGGKSNSSVSLGNYRLSHDGFEGILLRCILEIQGLTYNFIQFLARISEDIII